MKLKIILLAISFHLVLAGYAGDKTSISINIRNYQDSILLMTSYYGDRVILVDTAFSDYPGVFVFERDEPFPGGIYMAVSPSRKKLFEFIIDRGQEFTLTTDTVNFVQKMYVRGSDENKLFFEYMRFNEDLFRENRRLSDQLAKTDQEDERRLITGRLDSLKKEAAAYKLDLMQSHPQLFLAKMFDAMRDVEIPDSVGSSGDSAAVYRYYKAHYWDFLDLSDPRLLRTPVLARKVDQYMDQLVFIHPDSTIAAIREILSMSRQSEEVFSWLAWHFLSEYQEPEYMGFDKVFIFLVDEYFSVTEINNLTPSIRQNLAERAEAMRPLLLGSPAPDLMLIDSAGSYRSFRSIEEEYVILFFWDIECGICKKEILDLQDLYADKAFDLEVYAISVNGDLEAWKKNLREGGYSWINVNGTRSVTQDFHDLYDIHGTPAIFILDKDRKIIAKHLSADQIAGLLQNQNRKR